MLIPAGVAWLIAVYRPLSIMRKIKPAPNQTNTMAQVGRTSYLAKLALVCALFFLFSFVAISFHHHHDGCMHDDCPICMAAFVMCTAAVGIGHFLYAVYIAVCRLEAFDPTPVHVFPCPYLPDTRAPPA